MGIVPQASMGKAIGEIDILKTQTEQLSKSIIKVFNNKKGEKGEFKLETQGVAKVFQYNIAPETTKAGEVNSAVGIIREITELKNLEDKLRQQTEHLEEIVRQRTIELKNAERMAGIGETAGMIGHDIRNPLQSITSTVYLAKEEIKGLPEGKTKNNLIESMDLIEEQSDYISKIILDLQDYARKLCPEIKEYNVRDIVERALRTIKIPQNIEVRMNLSEDLPKVATDASYLERSLLNLINNGLQAMPNGGKISIATKMVNDKIELSVQDTGTGIPYEKRGQIFKPLFTTKAKGQGFGLAVCKRLMEAQNSEVTFTSEEGKGTKFILTLQAAK